MSNNRQTFRQLLLLVILFAAFGSVSAQSFATVGTASSIGGNCYELTAGGTNELGAIWSTTQIDLTQPFDYTFHVNFPVWGADGMAFVLHQDPAGTSALAANPGNTLGAYHTLPGGTVGGVTPGIAWELDIWNNAPAGADDIPGACCADDHVAVMNTASPGSAILGPVFARTGGADITDNLCRRFRTTWNPGTQLIELYYDNNLMLSGNFDIINNIFGGNPIVWWGFTASSGGVAANFQVCMENLTELPTDTFMCPGTPLTITPNAFGSSSYQWFPVTPNTCGTGYANFSPSCGTCFGCCPGVAACCPTCANATYDWDPVGGNGVYAIDIDVTNGIGSNGCRDTLTLNITADCTLPIEIGAFEAAAVGSAVQLDWTTISEINSDYFIIQRAPENSRFEDIGQVDAATFSTKQIDYQFVDPAPMYGENQYRLKMVDQDGTAGYSEIRTVLFDLPPFDQLENVYPNPAYDQVTFECLHSEAKTARIEFFNLQGRSVLVENFDQDRGGRFFHEVDLSQLDSGLYLYRVNIGGSVFQGKLNVMRQ